MRPTKSTVRALTWKHGHGRPLVTRLARKAPDPWAIFHDGSIAIRRDGTPAPPDAEPSAAFCSSQCPAAWVGPQHSRDRSPAVRVSFLPHNRGAEFFTVWQHNYGKSPFSIAFCMFTRPGANKKFHTIGFFWTLGHRTLGHQWLWDHRVLPRLWLLQELQSEAKRLVSSCKASAKLKTVQKDCRLNWPGRETDHCRTDAIECNWRNCHIVTMMVSDDFWMSCVFCSISMLKWLCILRQLYTIMKVLEKTPYLSFRSCWVQNWFTAFHSNRSGLVFRTTSASTRSGWQRPRTIRRSRRIQTECLCSSANTAVNSLGQRPAWCSCLSALTSLNKSQQVSTSLNKFQQVSTFLIFLDLPCFFLLLVSKHVSVLLPRFLASSETN